MARIQLPKWKSFGRAVSVEGGDCCCDVESGVWPYLAGGGSGRPGVVAPRAQGILGVHVGHVTDICIYHVYLLADFEDGTSYQTPGIFVASGKIPHNDPEETDAPIAHFRETRYTMSEGIIFGSITIEWEVSKPVRRYRLFTQEIDLGNDDYGEISVPPQATSVTISANSPRAVIGYFNGKPVANQSGLLFNGSQAFNVVSKKPVVETNLSGFYWTKKEYRTDQTTGRMYPVTVGECWGSDTIPHSKGFLEASPSIAYSLQLISGQYHLFYFGKDCDTVNPNGRAFGRLFWGPYAGGVVFCDGKFVTNIYDTLAFEYGTAGVSSMILGETARDYRYDNHFLYWAKFDAPNRSSVTWCAVNQDGVIDNATVPWGTAVRSVRGSQAIWIPNYGSDGPSGYYCYKGKFIPVARGGANAMEFSIAGRYASFHRTYGAGALPPSTHETDLYFDGELKTTYGCDVSVSGTGFKYEIARTIYWDSVTPDTYSLLYQGDKTATLEIRNYPLTPNGYNVNMWESGDYYAVQLDRNSPTLTLYHQGERQFTFDAAPNYEPYFHPVDASGIYCMLQGTIPGRDGNIHLLKDNELTPQSVTFMYPEDLYLVEHGHYQAIIDGYYGQSNAPAFLFRDGTYVSKQSDYAPLAARLCGNYLYVTNGIDIKVWDDGGTLLLDDRLFNDNSNGESFVTEVGATDYDKTAQMQGRLACITDDKMIHVFDNDFGHMKFDINFKRIA